MISLLKMSEQKVGQVWTEADHLRLTDQLDQVDRLAQALHDWRERTFKAPQKRD